jgi:hypothetical protein
MIAAAQAAASSAQSSGRSPCSRASKSLRYLDQLLLGPGTGALAAAAASESSCRLVTADLKAEKVQP